MQQGTEITAWPVQNGHSYPSEGFDCRYLRTKYASDGSTRIVVRVDGRVRELPCDPPISGEPWTGWAFQKRNA